MAIGGSISNNPVVGDVLFVGAGGVLAQDAAFVWDATHHRLGVGLTGPVGAIHVAYQTNDYTNTAGANAFYVLDMGGFGTQAAIVALYNGSDVAKWRTDNVGNINWVAYASGTQNFYMGGDFSVGAVRLRIGPNSSGGVVTCNNSGDGPAQLSSYTSASSRPAIAAIAAASQTAPIYVIQAPSSTATNRDVGYIDGGFTINTDAVYTGFIRICAQDFNGISGGREGMRVTSSGAGTELGFYGATPVLKPSVTGSKGGNVALANLMTALANLGLVIDSTT